MTKHLTGSCVYESADSEEWNIEGLDINTSQLLSVFFLLSTFSPTGKYLPSVVLDDFILSLKPALEMRTVYRQTTHGVRVTVVPFFLGAIDSDFYVRMKILSCLPLKSDLSSLPVFF